MAKPVLAIRDWIGGTLCAAVIVAGSAALAQDPPPAPASVPVLAAPPSLGASAAQIEALLASGQGEAAITAARLFLRQVTETAGFRVTGARLTAAPAEGYGVYVPRQSPVYAPGEPVYAYVEVHGFSLTPQPDGVQRMLFDVSFTLDSAEGEQMTESMIPMGEVRLDSRSLPIDGYFHLTYRVTGATGRFVLRTEVIDRASGQRAEFLLPVEFHEPARDADGK